ncbi:DNA-binding protein [Tabrizicola sp. DMG-N-6]|uniref:DNA-binding protein n=2 Tax=Szabonella alba TaxID=2804194 RepID=A0A8K0VCT5_9RHOB|nr:DNA-binding protein [Szabonella alba]
MGKSLAIPDDPAPLDRWRADDVLEPNRDLWGMKSIASCLGVAVETARRWANDPASDLPVTKPMGRWFARSRELRAWRARR